MSPCDRVRGILLVWSPQHDLPDEAVEHLEACPGCMAAFDERFPPVPAPEAAAPQRARRRPVVWLAAAALVLLAPALWTETSEPALAQALPLECPLPVELPPECPPA